MNAIINTLSNPVLRAACDANLVAFWATYGRTPQGEIDEHEQLVKMMTGIPFPLFNGIYYTQLEPDAVATETEALQAAVQRWGTAAFWWVGPASTPQDLPERLAQNGLVHADYLTAMVMDLNTLDADAPVPPGFSLRLIDDVALIDTWAHVVTVGSDLSPDVIAPLREFEHAIGIHPPAIARRYLGYMHDVPVATSVLVMHAGVAGIYAVATLPEHRRQGIGAAMTRLPLLDAQAAGYQVGTLQATHMGKPVYQRLGFQDYGRIDLYLLAPQTT